MKNFIKKFKNFIKRVEFSKLIAGTTILILLIIAIYSVIDFNITQKMAIQNNVSFTPVPEVAVECIRGILVTILIYCSYQFGNKNSRNRYGIDADGIPYMNTIMNWLDEQGITLPKYILNKDDQEDDVDDIS